LAIPLDQSPGVLIIENHRQLGEFKFLEENPEFHIFLTFFAKTSHQKSTPKPNVMLYLVSTKKLPPGWHLVCLPYALLQHSKLAKNICFIVFNRKFPRLNNFVTAFFKECHLITGTLLVEWKQIRCM
jgi:hypothetical protein